MLINLYAICVLSIAAQSDDNQAQQAVISEICAELHNSDNVLLQQAAKLLELELTEVEWSPTPRVYTFGSTNAKKRSKGKRKKEKREITFEHKRWQALSKIVFARGQPAQAEQCSYDYAQRAIILAKQTNLAQQIQDFSDGKFGNAAYLAARCESILDSNVEMAKSADYFDHTYRDLSSYLFVGVRLYDIWGAETLVDILDEAAMAFVTDVQGEKRLRDRIGAWLYDEIKVNFYQYRRYRKVRHALANLHLDPNAVIESELEGLRSNLNHAWMLVKHDPHLMALRLEEAGNRDVFFAELSEELKAVYQPALGLEVAAHFPQNRDDRAAAANAIKTIAETVLKRH